MTECMVACGDNKLLKSSWSEEDAQKSNAQKIVIANRYHFVHCLDFNA